MQRTVESEALVDLGVEDRIQAPLPGHDEDRIARDQVNQRERQQRHPDERRHDQGRATEHEADHGDQSTLAWRNSLLPKGLGTKPRTRRFTAVMTIPCASGMMLTSSYTMRWACT